MLKPYRILLYLLSFLISFVLGLAYAGWIEAGKGQMLAAAAIVLSYGVVAAFLGLVASVFVGRKLSRSVIIRLNLVLALAVAGSFGYFYINHQQRQKAKQEQHLPETEQRQPTAPAEPLQRQAVPSSE